MSMEWLHTVLINADDGGKREELCKGKASALDSCGAAEWLTVWLSVRGNIAAQK